MVAILTLIVPILGFLITSALGAPKPMSGKEFKEQGVWGPTAVWYWRCLSPFIIEASWDLEHWKPSSVCLEGTCCSILADGPLCSKDACRSVSKESGKPKAQDPLTVTGGRSPSRGT
ncbi:hypothetical protein KVR01_007508 [Diaporthe batatas]|uniref:uncharacterized protein n=1 Tax=Diaporthe batatas TaxID=748121 RepID=UPI001D058A0F|nr:uncharacterized protein KVR01_007508 [Diaporthe batatas]KAG8163030.1 hypothetical protein KVR01_007508 [Diaporthe batatas]